MVTNILSPDPKVQKQREYRCIDWHATKRSETRIEARNAGTGARLHFTVAFGRVFSVTSEQSGATHEIYGGACTCQDKERALKAGRRCRHEAALECVEALIDREREARERDLRTPNKLRNRLETLQGTISAAQEIARALAGEGVREVAL